ncbi:MAG: DUF91 domain-containing protein [Mojavia pulchra JT2-VF2]|jgi:hypothetical protein|uniref:DUF91 domain-containing protein n=1 Tax=Mojavia pulchra JT2-VF2 TaxID=287848 RepID=A0A951Q5K6_9NOST|nr:DUF91 domain-containing protein [Mojavia pulchra JT2-VF2]
MPYLKAKNLTVSSKRLNDELEKVNPHLIYVGSKINFQSELHLEDYLEDNFQKIFPDLALVKRQHNIKMQRCDLLCFNKSDKQPVIIELKNEEDRGLVSQLTRYRKAILQEQPFSDIIDYSLPVKLIAVAPAFHEDNYTDKEASKFEDDLSFYEFTIKIHENSAQFQICSKTYDIPYPILGLPESQTSSDLSQRNLSIFIINFTSNLPLEYRQDFLALRSTLMAQPKVKEMVSSTYRKVLYATGEGENHKKLAEITNTSKGVILFLWLPTHVKTNIKIPVARFGFILAKDNNPFSEKSIVEWLVCTKTTIELKNHPNNNIGLSFNRHGMTLWTKANQYLFQASLGSQNTFQLLIYLLKGIKPPIDEETFTWWNSYKSKTPENLGWYIDLAIKTWNYRFK